MLTSENRHWSRRGVADYLLKLSRQNKRVLTGFDFSFSLPYLDRGQYFPDLAESPDNVAALWDFLEVYCCEDADFYGGAILKDDMLKSYFHSAGRKGGRYEKRLRITERACHVQGLGRAESSFHLIGPTQVGLASFAGMRMLAYLKKQNPDIAIWPFDPVSSTGLTIVEIYTRLFLNLAQQGRRKIRSWDDADQALKHFSVSPVSATTRQMQATDHRTDAMIAAAGLRHISGQLSVKSYPWLKKSEDDERFTFEGWTFGVG